MSYGKSWEKFPIEENEIWIEQKTNSIIRVWDLTKGIPIEFKNIEMIYCDSPWSLNNVNMFNKKAGREYMNSFNEFANPFFGNIQKVNARVCFLEIGMKELDMFTEKLSKIYTCIQSWNILYYNKYPCILLRGSDTFTKYDYNGLDDKHTPLICINNESPSSVIDFCTGRGLTGIAANIKGIQFFGTELNKRKLAVFIDRANKKGFKYAKSL